MFATHLVVSPVEPVRHGDIDARRRLQVPTRSGQAELAISTRLMFLRARPEWKSDCRGGRLSQGDGNSCEELQPHFGTLENDKKWNSFQKAHCRKGLVRDEEDSFIGKIRCPGVHHGQPLSSLHSLDSARRRDYYLGIFNLVAAI